MIDAGISKVVFRTDTEIKRSSSIRAFIKGYRITTATGKSKTEYNKTKEADNMTNENTVTQDQLKFAEQDANHKLDIINIKIDALTKSVNAISIKADGLDELKTTTAVLSEKESTTRALAWAIVVAIVGGLIKLILF
ncbi:hypothetical protein [Lacticaseibacillus rhamnosus]|uniref:hypothetical protein n=1 Tax=Lacticaseibacillus rhamnosus TaxID=47715 RepID=UPI001F2CC113|nr:hypothetical protein [Lacticaseibacillus rhamnosus]